MDVEFPTIPDLLAATPRLRIDARSLDTALVFAFSGSSSGGLFAEALARATVPESTWEPEGYVSDLFLQRLVTECFAAAPKGEPALSASSHLLKVLAAPPREPATVEFRRGIAGELLKSPALADELRALHKALLTFRNLLEGVFAMDRHDPNRRQLDILREFSQVVESLASGFVAAQSGLSRLNAFGRRIQGDEAYQSLLSLLRHEDETATVDFRLRMGADGRVRHLELLAVRENDQSPFHITPARRWLAKLELLFRGFRFSDGEVMARLLDAVFEGVRQEFLYLVQLLGDVEFYVGALRFHARATAAGLGVCMPSLGSPERPRELVGLFNPLLLGAGIQPIPCDVATDRHDTTLLITGPNSGGKTRLLQALGLCQVLAQSGLFVPALRAQMALSDGLVVSLIQETSFDQAEGRLGMELLRIRAIFERVPPGAMVILDELCSGTNPSEGEEIFELVVRMLSRLRPQAFITTHFLEFASRLKDSGHINELRYLKVVLGPSNEPTYQFAPGVAKTSLASQAAARLGVTGEQLMGLIEQKLLVAGRGG